MASVKIIISFIKLRDDDLDTTSQIIINKMTDNVNFPTPTPDSKVIVELRKAYVDALTEVRNGGKEATALKNETRKALEAQLRLLALYVQANCKNNEVIALSSGFSIQKTSSPVGILAKPEKFKVEDGPASGTLIVSCQKIAGAKTYLFEMTDAPLTATSVWLPKFSTTKLLMIEGLVAGKQYAFRMAGIGADPLLVYSDVLLRYVQ